MRHINKGDQFVVACVDSPETAPAVIAAARLFAGRLRNKSLMLLNVSGDNSASGWLKQYDIPFAALRGDWATAIEGLPTVFNAVLAVTAVDAAAPRSSIANPRTLLRAFRRCKIAYLTIPVSGVQSAVRSDAAQNSGRKPNTEHSSLHAGLTTVLTVDHHRESKEKLIWASYLARFLGASLTVALPQYKDAGLSTLQNNNIRYIDKIFPPQGISYTKRSIDTGGLNTSPDLQALDTLHPDLFVALTTDPRATDPLDWLFGTPDRRIITHPSATPVLLLNPRDDLYVLCD